MTPCGFDSHPGYWSPAIRPDGRAGPITFARPAEGEREARMKDPSASLPSPAPGTPPGLCATCRHSRVIVARGGSTFRLCRLAEHDPRFAKYPRLPVEVCRGYASASPE